MVTQTKDGNCYKRITSRQKVAKDIEEDADGMGKKDNLYHKANKPITANKGTLQKGRTTRTYLEEGNSQSHTSKGRATRTCSKRQGKEQNGRCYKRSVIINIYAFFATNANNHMGD